MNKVTLVFEGRTGDFLRNIINNYGDFFDGTKPDEMITETDDTKVSTRIKYK